MESSKEQIKQIKSKLKKLNMLTRKNKKILGYDFKLINWLCDEVLRGFPESFDKQVFLEEIDKDELSRRKIAIELWKMIDDPKASAMERKQSIKLLIENQLFPLKMLFNFKKKLKKRKKL